MKVLIFLTLVGLAASAPASNVTTTASPDESITIDQSFFAGDFLVHTAEHDIVKLYFPINALNLGDDDDEEETQDKFIFYVEADKNGELKGISVLLNSNATLLLPTGTSVASGVEDVKVAYFGATDGLYRYNATRNAAEKFGTITDSIIDIAKDNATDDLYIVTDKNEVYKVTENGTKKDLVAEAAGAKRIVFDDSKNLYFYGEDRKIKVLTENGVVKVEGLPESTDVKLFNPAFAMEQSILAVVDNKGYLVYSNGSAEFASIEFEVKPNAISIEGTLIMYMSSGRNIYEYNVLQILLSAAEDDALSELKDFLKGKENEIETLSSKSRSDIQ